MARCGLVGYRRAMPLGHSFDDVEVWWCSLCQKTFPTRVGMDSMPNECSYCEREEDRFHLGEPYDGQDECE